VRLSRLRLRRHNRLVTGDAQTWKRITIVGGGGAGKSTLAVQVAGRLGMPVIHLDRHFWRPGWVPAPTDAWRQTVTELVSAPEWVMDGNFADSLDLRLTRSDAIVFLDLPRRIAIRRALGRLLRWWGRTRPDLPPGCPESFDLQFIRWMWRFPKEGRVELLATIAEADAERRMIRLTSPKQVQVWLDTLP
jgi:adenylate kinase family enzyme